MICSASRRLPGDGFTGWIDDHPHQGHRHHPAAGPQPVHRGLPQPSLFDRLPTRPFGDEPYCAGIIRNPSIAALGAAAVLGGDAKSNFIAINRGSVMTSGIDVQLGYRLPTDFPRKNRR